MGGAMTLRARVERVAKGLTGPTSAVPVKEVWLPAVPGGDPPGRYHVPGSWVVLVRYPEETPQEDSR